MLNYFITQKTVNLINNQMIVNYWIIHLFYVVNGYHFGYQVDKYQAKYIFFTVAIGSKEKRDFYEFTNCHFLINLQSNCADFMKSDIC